MPLKLLKEISPTASLAVWQIAETEEFFLNSLQLLPNDKATIRSIKLQKARLQKLACRAALSKLLNTNEIEITYSKTGQPLLQNYHISFSHTKTAVAVALAKTAIGIDIEELTPRILSLYTRFMSEKEIEDCNLNHLQDLYYYWCAKEAMYKWFANKNLDFIKDLQVIKNEKKGIICKKDIVQLVDLHIDNQIIIVCF
jgi:phosphopantetheinyl transferase